MSRFRVVLNRAGIREVLNSPEVQAMVTDAAEVIASGARARGARDVVVEPYSTDRAAAAVVVRDPTAVGQEAKRGILSGPARGIGADYRGR